MNYDRTEEEIWKQTQDLARRFYRLMGYETPEGFRFDRSGHPQERMCWVMACAAQEDLTDTDPEQYEPEEPEPNAPGELPGAELK